MAKTSKTKGFEKLSDPEPYLASPVRGAPRVKPLTPLRHPSRPIRASSLRTTRIH